MCWPTCANYAFSIMSGKNLMNSSPIWNIWGICSAYIITGLKYAAGSFRKLHLHAGTQLYSVLFQFIVFYLCSSCVPKNRALWGQSIACFLCLFLWTFTPFEVTYSICTHICKYLVSQSSSFSTFQVPLAFDKQNWDKFLACKENNIYLFSHLADAFIQSDLQMRTL